MQFIPDFFALLQPGLSVLMPTERVRLIVEDTPSKKKGRLPFRQDELGCNCSENIGRFGLGTPLKIR